jgi:hypothetical protein
MSFPSANPFGVWFTLAAKTSEMLLASGQVIAHRLNRIARAGINPDARDRKEFTLMAQEKVDAMFESQQAMGMRLMRMAQQAGALLFKQWLDAGSRMIGLAVSRDLAQSTSKQSAFVQASPANLAALFSQWSQAMAGLAHHGLKPIHARATSNAKRLARI